MMGFIGKTTNRFFRAQDMVSFTQKDCLMPAPEVGKDETALLDEIFLDCVNDDVVFLPSKENKPHVNEKNANCQSDMKDIIFNTIIEPVDFQNAGRSRRPISHQQKNVPFSWPKGIASKLKHDLEVTKHRHIIQQKLDAFADTMTESGLESCAKPIDDSFKSQTAKKIPRNEKANNIDGSFGSFATACNGATSKATKSSDLCSEGCNDKEVNVLPCESGQKFDSLTGKGNENLISLMRSKENQTHFGFLQKMKKTERDRKEKRKQNAELHIMRKEEIRSTILHKEVLEREVWEQGAENARKKLKYLRLLNEDSEDYNVEQEIKRTNAAKREKIRCTIDQSKVNSEYLRINSKLFCAVEKALEDPLDGSALVFSCNAVIGESRQILNLLERAKAKQIVSSQRWKIFQEEHGSIRRVIRSLNTIMCNLKLQEDKSSALEVIEIKKTGELIDQNQQRCSLQKTLLDESKRELDCWNCMVQNLRSSFNSMNSCIKNSLLAIGTHFDLQGRGVDKLKKAKEELIVEIKKMSNTICTTETQKQNIFQEIVGMNGYMEDFIESVLKDV